MIAFHLLPLFVRGDSLFFLSTTAPIESNLICSCRAVRQIQISFNCIYERQRQAFSFPRNQQIIHIIKTLRVLLLLLLLLLCTAPLLLFYSSSASCYPITDTITDTNSNSTMQMDPLLDAQKEREEREERKGERIAHAHRVGDLHVTPFLKLTSFILPPQK